MEGAKEKGTASNDLRLQCLSESSVNPILITSPVRQEHHAGMAADANLYKIFAY